MTEQAREGSQDDRWVALRKRTVQERPMGKLTSEELGVFERLSVLAPVLDPKLREQFEALVHLSRDERAERRLGEELGRA